MIFSCTPFSANEPCFAFLASSAARVEGDIIIAITLQAKTPRTTTCNRSGELKAGGNLRQAMDSSEGNDNMFKGYCVKFHAALGTTVAERASTVQRDWREFEVSNTTNNKAMTGRQ